MTSPATIFRSACLLLAADETEPDKHIKNAKTPTLILHGENDRFDPIGQAQQLHRGLTHYGVDCEFVIYPREAMASS